MIYSMKRRWLIIALIFLAASAGLTTVLLMRRSPTAKTADQQPTTEQPASEQQPAPAPPPNTDQEAQPTNPSTPPASSPTTPKQQPQAPPSAPPSRPTPPQQPQQPQPPRPTPPAPPARPTPPPTPPKPTPPPSKYDVGPPNALEMLELMNDARRRAGIRPLVLNSRLQYTAQWKADDMIRYNYFDHVRPGQDYANGLRLIGEQGLGCAWANENILQTTPQTHTSRGAFQIWMNSPGHRSAIMDGGRYGRTGFGVAGNKVVQHFCT